MSEIWEDFLYPKKEIENPTYKNLLSWKKNVKTYLGGLSEGFRSDFWLRGYKMLGDLGGKITFIQAFILSISGKLINTTEDRLLNAIITCNGLTDPRFWMFRASRLGATVKTTPAAAIAAGLFANEGKWLSAGAAYEAATFFINIEKHANDNELQLEKCIKSKLTDGEIIFGYGRVLARGPDERNIPVIKIAKECGLDKGRYIKLAFNIEKIIQRQKNKNIYLNNGGLVCALLLDMGLEPIHIMLFYTLVFYLGISSNLVEAYEESPGKFLPLSPTDIEYIGPKNLKIKKSSSRQNKIVIKNDIKIVTIDSISYLNETNKNDIIVCGSHGGLSAARYCLPYNLRGVVFNDAGIGKNSAGIKGLDILEKHSLAALTASHISCEIGNGQDTYENGIVSSTNQQAYKLGINIGDSIKEACFKMLKRSKSKNYKKT